MKTLITILLLCFCLTSYSQEEVYDARVVYVLKPDTTDFYEVVSSKWTMKIRWVEWNFQEYFGVYQTDLSFDTVKVYLYQDVPLVFSQLRCVGNKDKEDSPINCNDY